MKKTECLIIGAGISGLTFANYINRDYLIIEKENEVGGYCRTIKKGDFIWDYAGHFFHFKTEEFKNKFLNKMNKDDLVYNQKCTKILYKNKLIDFPFQTNIHQLEKQEFIDCLYDLFNKEEKDKYDDFLDMLYGKFGKSIVEKFLKPYNEKLYAIDLHELDVDAMGRFFPYANKEEIINNMKHTHINSYNSNFLYPKEGAGSFIKILYDNLDNSKVLLNTSLKNIDKETKMAELSNGEIIEYKYLINTMPLNKFVNITGDQAINKYLSYNKILVFNLGFDKESPLCKKEHWLYEPSKETNYYRVGFYNNILGSKKLSMYVEIGFSKESTIDDQEIQKQLALTLDKLQKSNIISEDMILEESIAIIMDPAYVHISKKSTKLVDELKEKFKKKDIFTIGRYGAWIYNSMEDSMLAAKVLAEKINESDVS